MNTKIIKTLAVAAIILFAYTVVAAGSPVNSDDSASQYAYTTDNTDNLSKTSLQNEYATSYWSNGNIAEYTVEKDLSGDVLTDRSLSTSLVEMKRSDKFEVSNSLERSENLVLSNETKSYDSVVGHFTLDRSTGIGDVSIDFLSETAQVYSDDLRMKVEQNADKSIKSAELYTGTSWEDVSSLNVASFQNDELELCFLPAVLAGIALVDWVILWLAAGTAVVGILWDDLVKSANEEAKQAGTTADGITITDDVKYVKIGGVPKYIYVNEKAADAVVLNDENINSSKAKDGKYFFTLRYSDNLYFAPIEMNESQARAVIDRNNSDYNTWTKLKTDAGKICIKNNLSAYYEDAHKPGYFNHYHVRNSSDITKHLKAHSFYGFQVW